MNVDYTKATKAALDVIAQHKINTPPINIDEIIKFYSLEIKIVFFPNGYKDVSGFLDMKEKQIFVNYEDTPERQNFTKAHELGHWILHKELFEKEPLKQLLLRRENTNETSEEKEANKFAAELLIPEKILKECIIKYPFYGVEELSRLFSVSKSFMAYRINNILGN